MKGISNHPPLQIFLHLPLKWLTAIPPPPPPPVLDWSPWCDKGGSVQGCIVL